MMMISVGGFYLPALFYDQIISLLLNYVIGFGSKLYNIQYFFNHESEIKYHKKRLI